MKKFKYVLILWCLVSLNAAAQTGASLSLFQLNPTFFNPALAGAHTELRLNTFYRRQWTKVPGSPKTLGFGASFPLSLNAGLGFTLVSDQIGTTQSNSFQTDASYRIPLSEKHKSVLAFGLNLGLNHHNRTPEGDQLNDPQFVSQAGYQFLPGFGLFYFDQIFFGGFSIPFLSFGDFNINDGIGGYETNVMHFNLGANLPLSRSVRMRPSGLMKTSQQFPLALEGNVVFIFNDKTLLGMGYRKQNGYQAIFGLKFSEHVEFDYAFDFGSNHSAFESGGSHEIHLIYKVGKAKQLAFKSNTCFGGKWKNYVYD